MKRSKKPKVKVAIVEDSAPAKTPALAPLPDTNYEKLEVVPLPSPDLFRYDSVVRVVKELFDRSKLLMISRLTPDLGALVTRFKAVSHVRQIPIYDYLGNVIMERSIGQNGLSREELRALVQAASKGNKKDKPNSSNRWSRGAKNENQDSDSGNE